MSNALATPARLFDHTETLQWIGRMNLCAISGGRVKVQRELATDHAVASMTLPVDCGYSVRITLAGNDTYTVERVFKRGAKVWVKGVVSDVHAEELGEACYQASSFRSNDFGGYTV